MGGRGGYLYGGTVSPEVERYNRMVELAEQIVGIHNVFTVCIIMAAAVVLGLTGFMYLHSKKQVDFYNSPSGAQELLYAVKYIDGILMILFHVPFESPVCRWRFFWPTGCRFPCSLPGALRPSRSI